MEKAQETLENAGIVEKNVLKQGDKAALLGIGSGLNCMMMGIEW